MRKTPVTQASGVVDAPVERVRAVPAEIVAAASPSHGTAHAHPPPKVEAVDGGVAVQGDRSHRGEWTVSPRPGSALLVHRVYNVARWSRWGVPLANRFFIGFRQATRAGFADVLRRLAERVGGTARLTDDAR